MDRIANALPSVAMANATAEVKSTGSYLDFEGLGALKGKAAKDSKGAMRETAQQFEALFLQMMMKSMRDASFKSDLVESQAKDTFEGMFDKEVSLAMAKRNTLGLADMLVKNMPDPAQQGASSAADTRAAQAALSTQNILESRSQAMRLQPAASHGLSLTPRAAALHALPRGGSAFSLSPAQRATKVAEDTP